MSKVLVIARREFIERVRTKGFWIGTILFPILMSAIVLVPALLARGGGTKRIAVVDQAPAPIGQLVTDVLDSTPTFDAVRVAAGPGVVDSLTREVGAKRLDGLVLLPPDIVETGRGEYRASNVSSFDALEVLRDRLRRVVVATRFAREGIDARLVQRAQIGIQLETKKISRGVTTGESAGQSFALGYVMAILLYFAILVYGIGLMQSVLEEKTSKIVEVLVSSLRPFQLLAGKLVGVGGTSLFQFLIWAISTRILLSQRGPIMSRLGGDGAAGFFQLPSVPASTAALFLFYFVGGFLLYSAMFAAVGAMSNSHQEAQQAQQPVTMLLMLSMFSLLAMITNPGSTYAVVLSLIPFSAPIAMPVRWVAGSVPLEEVLASMAFLVVGIIAVLWVAARIYRVGILMTGKRPTIRELVRWVRTA
jgi:ABC-2 type transport system permease protein